jgi:hypothetical protein
MMTTMGSKLISIKFFDLLLQEIKKNKFFKITLKKRFSAITQSSVSTRRHSHNRNRKRLKYRLNHNYNHHNHHHSNRLKGHNSLYSSMTSLDESTISLNIITVILNMG